MMWTVFFLPTPMAKQIICLTSILHWQAFWRKKPFFWGQRPTLGQRLIWAETPFMALYWHRTHLLF